ncbi:phage tail assembly chaperone [Burkholderia territorii]|uniref:phage tail assembly chaperone n=1 Tax=Burkholderia territorii TaxID=1503055 RepID=UPI000756B867|nr:phage tail assembly chaperone [Burkholderia territorii]KUZ33578.1 phage tail protein [Burkholderia territorii]KUZ43575.1 phage tail protein [Burkholderia territorii]
MTSKSKAGALRAAILNPLAGWRHELVPMPEWDGVIVAVREPLLEDRAFWLEPLREAAGVEPDDDEHTARAKYGRVSADAHKLAYARLFVRVLYVETPDGWRREFDDDDVEAVAAAYGVAHDRVVTKAIALGGLGTDPEEAGKKPSAETPISDSK